MVYNFPVALYRSGSLSPNFRGQEHCDPCPVYSRESSHGSAEQVLGLESGIPGSSPTSARTQEQASLLCSMAPVCRSL